MLSSVFGRAWIAAKSVFKAHGEFCFLISSHLATIPPVLLWVCVLCLYLDMFKPPTVQMKAKYIWSVKPVYQVVPPPIRIHSHSYSFLPPHFLKRRTSLIQTLNPFSLPPLSLLDGVRGGGWDVIRAELTALKELFSAGWNFFLRISSSQRTYPQTHTATLFLLIFWATFLVIYNSRRVLDWAGMRNKGRCVSMLRRI